MDEAAYDFESAVWYDIENNKMHLKKDGDHYVADATLFRGNLNLRQENYVLRQERDRLRDIVRMYASYVDDDRCEGCVCKRACNDGMVEECWQLTEIRKAEKEARELGIEI